MPIPLAGGLPSSVRAVRGCWPSSSRVVPPRDRRSAADRTAGSGAGVSSKGWPRLGQLELEGGAQICAGTFRGLPEPPQLPALPPSTRGQALHRLGFVLKRPKERLLKAAAAQRETFVAEYAALVDEAQQVEAQVFFVDEAHFRADADPVSGYGTGSAGPMGAQMRASPRWGEKASYYSAVCLGTKSAVQEKVNNFFTQLAGWQAEVKQRCRTVLQTRAEGLLGKAHADPRRPINVDPPLVSV